MKRVYLGLIAIGLLLSSCGINGDPLTPPAKSTTSPIIAQF